MFVLSVQAAGGGAFVDLLHGHNTGGNFRRIFKTLVEDSPTSFWILSIFDKSSNGYLQRYLNVSGICFVR
jgi:hypothetical protein